MGSQTVEAMIEGGKASAAPPLGPALGPTGLNIGKVISDINAKTASFKGMQVPVKIHFDTATKEYSIEIGTPPTSSLLKKEANVEKGSGMPHADKVADIRIEQIIKVAKMKEDSLNGKTLKQRVKNIVGTCTSLGFLIQGKEPFDIIKEIDEGKFDKEIASEKTELTAEELKEIEEHKKKLAENVAKRHAEEEKKANDILTSLAGKEKTVIKARLREGGISESLITKLVAGIGGAPAAAGALAAPGAKPAEKARSSEKKK